MEKISRQNPVFWIVVVVMFMTTGFAQAQDSINQKVPTPTLLNPSNWLQQTENSILLFESRLLTGVDTAFMNEKYGRMMKDLELILNDFKSHGNVMRIRSLDDVKAKLLQQKKDIDKWRNSIRKQNDGITSNYLEIHRLQTDSVKYSLSSDSSLWKIYAPAFREMENDLTRVERQYQSVLQQTVNIENALNVTNFNISRAIIAVDKELDQRRSALFNRTHPPFWELTSNSYPQGIGPVFMETLNQNLDSLKFYAKNAYIRVILFRILVLLITLLPIWYFRKHKKQLENKDRNESYKFVHKYTGAATSSFVLVMAPFIFINSPHIFTEVILATLAFTTCMIFLKENPKVEKKYLYAILGAYVILKAMNLMVSVTYFGRIVWTVSIVALYPLYGFYKSVMDTTVGKKWLFRLITVITALMFLGGWILNFTGHYPLGRILLLAGLDQFFLAIVLYVAIYSFIDFVAIIANIYNSPDRLTQVRVDLIYDKLLYLVRFLAVVFWFSTLLININAVQFLKENVFSVFNTTLSIGNFTYTPGSLLIFFIVVYLAFYLSGLLDGLFFDEKRSDEVSGKTSLGSIVLMLRLFVISMGFIIGLVLAGIPLNNLNLFVGALGVGIGFGLQSLIANLISGIIIAFEKPIYVGDIIEVDGSRGRVTDIGIRATKVDTADGAEFIVPNGEMISKVLKNWTLNNRNFKIDTSFSVDHSNNANMVADLVEEVLNETPFILPYPKPKVQLKEIEPQYMRFALSCWISNISDSGQLKSELLKKIHNRMDEAGVVYPKKS
ncbi:MAG TPA: mechanosensitive ion channel domain-containing protein [Chitinophagaceae bacterium]|nr:mechanosensitive ion channel domain-containing protein [Chitinophagaceae bacterium]